MRDIQCPHCLSYINAREIVTRCTECKELINNPKTKEMKATLENFLIKLDGNNPLWEEFIEWVNKVGTQSFFRGDSQNNFYGIVSCNKICTEELDGLEKELLITLEQWKELINPKTMNRFKKGDKVFVYPYGWCEFVSHYENTNTCWVENNGNAFQVDIRLISYTEYTLQGLTQERPFEPVVGQMYYFWNDEMLVQKRVFCAFYKGYGSENYPYGMGVNKGQLNYQHISETNPLL
jgi:hypothetical protein